MDSEMNEENGENEMTQRFWAIVVESGKPITIEDLPAALHVTQVALDAEAKGKGRTSLTVSVNGKKTTLGSVSETIPQFSLDLIFDDDESEIIFEAVGTNKIHVAGSYIVPEGDEGDLSDGFGPQFVDGEISGEDEEESDEEAEQDIVPPPKGKVTANKPQKAQAQQTQSQPEAQKNNKRKNEDVQKTTPEAQTKKAKAQTPPTKATPEKESPKEKNPMKRQLANGLVVEDLVLGNGKEANPGQKIGVMYVGRLTNGKQFDSSLNKPFQFRLGTGEVIKGWDEGVKGMRVGGKRKLIIPPSLGYKNQRAGDIPPNSTLIFEVELVRA